MQYWDRAKTPVCYLKITKLTKSIETQEVNLTCSVQEKSQKILSG